CHAAVWMEEQANARPLWRERRRRTSACSTPQARDARPAPTPPVVVRKRAWRSIPIASASAGPMAGPSARKIFHPSFHPSQTPILIDDLCGSTLIRHIAILRVVAKDRRRHSKTTLSQTHRLLGHPAAT